MEQAIEVLRVEQKGISKELNTFRACDSETRSLYCREWAQYIYKKHFVWNAKTQEDVATPNDQHNANIIHTVKAGKYQINFLPTTTNSGHKDNEQEEEEEDQEELGIMKKEDSFLLGKKFGELAASWTAADSMSVDQVSLLNQIMTACQLWMTLPSGYSGLPDCFELVEFNPYPDNIPLVDDVKDPSQLLDPLIIERQALCLPSDCFHLLKNLTGDILLSHTTPTCGHSKPDSKTPADLEVDRAIFNEHEQTAVTQALKELALALETAWYPLNQFLKHLNDLENRRSQLMGKGCQANIDQYFTNQKYVSFVDVWTGELHANFKNKKSTEEEINKVDTLFQGHLEGLKKLVKEFMSDFTSKVLQDIHALTSELWNMVIPTYTELRDRMTKREAAKKKQQQQQQQQQGGGTTTSPKSLVDMEALKKMEFTKDVDAATKRITIELNTKVEEYFLEIDTLFKLYKESSRPNLSGRLEKLNNKDFKKKIKKVESGYYSLRQMFRYEVTEKIFPESLFCKVALLCLQPLLKEGEMVEALTIEMEVKRFLEAYKELWQQRSQLLHRFEQGVQTGRRELAGLLGKLFLKEGMRIQGDNLALKRQNSLLKSMGVDVDAAAESKKSKKKTGAKSASGASTPSQQQEDSDTSSSTVSSAINNNKKKNGSVAAPAAAAVAAPSPTVGADKKHAAVVSNKSVKSSTPKPASPVKVLKIVSTPKTEPPVVATTVKSPSLPPSKPVTPIPANKPTAPPGLFKATESVKKTEEANKTIEPVVKKAEETKKVSEPTKKIEEVKKVEELKENVKEPLFVYEELRAPPKPKVKSSKIPAPMPIIEKVEPKVTISTKKKSSTTIEKSNKKKESSLATTPVVTKKKKEEDKSTVTNDAVQDWESIRAAVTTASTKQEQSEEKQEQSWNDIVKQVENPPASAPAAIQDWNDLRAQVIQQEEEIPNEQVDDSWSTIAAKKPISVDTNWSSPSITAVATSIPIEVNSSADWGTTTTTTTATTTTATKNMASPALSTTSSAAWSTTATNGWGTSPAVSNTEKTTHSTGGWGSSVVVEEKSVSASSPGWSSTSVQEKKKPSPPPGWGNTQDGWNSSSSSPAPTTATASEKPTTTVEENFLGGWDKPSIAASWGAKKEKNHHHQKSLSNSNGVNWTTIPKPVRPENGGWDNNKSAQMPWDDESVPLASLGPTSHSTITTTTNQQATVTRGAPGLVQHQQQQSPPPPPPPTPQQQQLEEVKAIVPTVTTSTRPSGPPGLSIAGALEKQLSNAPSLLNSISSATSAVTTPTSATSFAQQQQSSPYQEALPTNLQDMAPEMLLLIIKNLHRENGSLISSVYTMQQEMSMMTSRYAEIMALAREREAQNLSLFESRKQTEMEGIKRYVLDLETMIKQLEGAAAKTTAGFGNQDLFAGYREEMRSNDYSGSGNQQQQQQQGRYQGGGGKKMWQKNNPIIRCGNCGEIGHESAKCKTNCRYCGSCEHLSEACPMN